MATEIAGETAVPPPAHPVRVVPRAASKHATALNVEWFDRSPDMLSLPGGHDAKFFSVWAYLLEDCT
jgi:hypothetical protein